MNVQGEDKPTLDQSLSELALENKGFKVSLVITKNDGEKQCPLKISFEYAGEANEGVCALMENELETMLKSRHWHLMETRKERNEDF